MNPSSASDSPFPASGTSAGATSGTYAGVADSSTGSSAASSGMSHEGAAAQAHATVQRMARAAHEAVDRLEQTLGAGSERVMDWQQEYGDMAREQVRSNPLAAVGIAFGVGILFSKLFMR